MAQVRALGALADELWLKSRSQVKDGTEHRGAIESVVRLVRKTVRGDLTLDIRSIFQFTPCSQLRTMQPPLPIPPNSKQRLHNGWAMIDVGDFAVHVLSRTSREKYFRT
jgi:hypothetical protein